MRTCASTPPRNTTSTGRWSSALLAAALLAAACGRGKDRASGSGAPAGVVEANVRTIAESTQAAYRDLRIGVGYVRGPVAGLWLYPRGKQDARMDVRAGQRVVLGDYVFVVEDVRAGILKGTVRVRFESPAPVSP